MNHDLDQLHELVSILMEGSVTGEELEVAAETVEIYRHDRLGLTLLHAFYARPPEDRHDSLREIRLAGRGQGVFLLAALCPAESWLYLVSDEGAELVGPLEAGIEEEELIEHFHLESAPAFRRRCARPEDFAILEPLAGDPDVCPACWSTTGEFHEIGCPVEICPWCGGQLIHCSCRFERFGLEAIADEADLAAFLDELERQGRIPYGPEQRPAFLNDDEDLGA